MYQACIFDLDGTLANTLPSIAYFANRALQKFGFRPIEQDRYRHLVGNGAKKLVLRMLEERDCRDEAMFRQVYSYYVAEYDRDPLYLTAPYAGVPELLRGLKAQGLRLGVLSNKPQGAAQSVAEALFGPECFDLCYGAREGYPLKPEPDVLLAMLRKWNLNPQDCLYIGDTSVDIQTAHNAGACGVGVLWGFRGEAELKEAGAAHILAEPGELLTLAMR